MGGTGSAAEVCKDGAERFGWINWRFGLGMFRAYPCHLDEVSKKSGELATGLILVVRELLEFWFPDSDESFE